MNAAGYIQKLKATKVQLLKELTAAQQRIEQLEEQARENQSYRLGLEAACDRYIKRANEGREAALESFTQSLEHRIRLQDAVERMANLYAYLERTEHQATRWQDPLPVPEWVGDVRAILEGEER
ncbi:MAG: hypothetical protein EPO08_21350 [Rhodospirillaceae bacterium]|nr:MAG: hypothetical protein EPO08_21350 [Rhodospirillaceae bacterium]